MDSIRNICVFCGSSSDAPQKYIDLAAETGKTLARLGYGVVYGGSRAGLMGALADAALAGGGKVIGVIPHFLKELEVAHDGLNELHLTRTMHERQVGMAERADAFLILPGALGTLAEFFEVLTWRQLALHVKPILLLNAFGYWDSLLAFMEHAEREAFMRKENRALFKPLQNIREMEIYLQKLKR